MPTLHFLLDSEPQLIIKKPYLLELTDLNLYIHIL